MIALPNSYRSGHCSISSGVSGAPRSVTLGRGVATWLIFASDSAALRYDGIHLNAKTSGQAQARNQSQSQASVQNENLTPSLTKAPSPDLPLLFEIRY